VCSIRHAPRPVFIQNVSGDEVAGCSRISNFSLSCSTYLVSVATQTKRPGASFRTVWVEETGCLTGHQMDNIFRVKNIDDIANAARKSKDKIFTTYICT
jgi:hypothetical protein